MIFSSNLSSRLKIKINGTTQNTMNSSDNIKYPLTLVQANQTLYAYSEWEASDYDGNTTSKSGDPTSIDIILDDNAILNLRSQTQTLNIRDFNKKTYVAGDYIISIAIN